MQRWVAPGGRRETLEGKSRGDSRGIEDGQAWREVDWVVIDYGVDERQGRRDTAKAVERKSERVI